MTNPTTRLALRKGEHPVVAAVYIPRRPENFVGTVLRLTEECKLPVVLGSHQPLEPGLLTELAVSRIETWSPATLMNDVWLATRAHVLAVTDAVLLPPAALDVALELLEADLRVGTVSFLSNDAAFLSFPHRNHPVERPVEGHDEISITRRLRSLLPGDSPVPIPFATGGATLISSVAIGAVGLLENARSGSFAPALADFCLRARRRGFVDLLDPSTFCARPSDVSVEPKVETLGTGLTPDDNGWLCDRHPDGHAFTDDQRTRSDSPLGLALSCARAKTLGLRVLVDGTCLGAQEMGTQVTTVALVAALSASPEVREICVVLPGKIPAYAQEVLSGPKVRSAPLAGGGLPEFGHFDIGHRPFQPNEGFEIEAWRAVTDRLLVTIHDLISFHISSYSGDTETWLRYRELMSESIREVDGVVVISGDVRQQVALNRLPVEPDRVFVVPNGTEHLTGNERSIAPAELEARGFTAAEFVLCLGTNYTHKNRDLAVRAFEELRRRGHDLALVLAGAAVPWGSSRSAEAAAAARGSVFVLPDVSAEERNWLLRHASAVLYPTSAEGFGLIPFEAARFGTPTVNVGFGPLAEVGVNQPVTASDWHPVSLADAADALLTDPALARRQIEQCLEAGTEYTWARTAEHLTVAYRTLLARPRR